MPSTIISPACAEGWKEGRRTREPRRRQHTPHHHLRTVTTAAAALTRWRNISFSGPLCDNMVPSQHSRLSATNAACRWPLASACLFISLLPSLPATTPPCRRKGRLARTPVSGRPYARLAAGDAVMPACSVIYYRHSTLFMPGGSGKPRLGTWCRLKVRTSPS